MPLSVPNIDDRTYEQLVSEARSMIPRYFPDWTDHNASDPGITLLELFAFLLEIAIYQINRVPERTLEHFALLLGIKRKNGEEIQDTLRRAIEHLNTENRAVTLEDFEKLAIEADPDSIARAKAVVQVVDTPTVSPDEQFVNVIIIPGDPGSITPEQMDSLRQEVFVYLRQRQPVTTRLRVLAPEYTDVSIAVEVVRDAEAILTKDDVSENVARTIRDFLDPLKGGEDGDGWEFGRSVFRSEIYQVVEGVSGVDHVYQLTLNGSEIANEIELLSPTHLVRLSGLEVEVTD